MTPAPVILLLGVSGVGKSRLARRIAQARPDILRLTAGGLLRANLHTTGEKLRTAPSENVRRNQQALGEALQAERAGQWERPVLLEGHGFIDNDRELVDVPTQVMRGLAPSAIILLDAEAFEVVQRREHDTRKRPARTVAEIGQHLQHARDLAHQYATELGVPICVITSADAASAIVFFDKIVAAAGGSSTTDI